MDPPALNTSDRNDLQRYLKPFFRKNVISAMNTRTLNCAYKPGNLYFIGNNRFNFCGSDFFFSFCDEDGKSVRLLFQSDKGIDL